MSTGTNSQRITQNNELLQQHNLDLTDILEQINDLPPALDTSDATATADDINLNKTAYVGGQKITGTLPLFPNTRTFTVDNAGVNDDTENSQLTFTTINTLKQTLDSNLTMQFSANYTDVCSTIGLTSDKLLVGNTILGVEGTGTADATATGDDMAQGKTAYVNGQKVTGNVFQHQTGASWDLADNEWVINSLNGILIPFNKPTMFQTGTSIYINKKGIINKAHITPEKIKLGETIFGVTGTYEGDSPIIQANTVEELPTETTESKIAVVMNSTNNTYGGTFKSVYKASETATETETQEDNLLVGLNVTKFKRTTYAPSSTMTDVTEDKLFFKNSSGSIWYGAKYDNITDPENPVLRIQLIDNGTVYQIGYYDYNQSKWNEEINEDIPLSEVCIISEINLENLAMMNGYFIYVTIEDSDKIIGWIELSAPGTITSAEYQKALQTSKEILGVDEVQE